MTEKAKKSYAKKVYVAGEGVAYEKMGMKFEWKDGKPATTYLISELPENIQRYAMVHSLAGTLGDLSSKESVTDAASYRQEIEERWALLKSGKWNKDATPLTPEEELARLKKREAVLLAQIAAGEGPKLPGE
jgi:hypothetical protein